MTPERLAEIFDQPKKILITDADGCDRDLTDDWVQIFELVTRDVEHKQAQVTHEDFCGRIEFTDGCGWCKTKIEGRWTFCPHCGRRIGERS